MSPASQGGLQVERYIGTCLISKSDAHPPSYRYPHGAHGAHGVHGAHHGAWAGLPLISMVQPRRSNSKQPGQQPQQSHQPHQAPQQPGAPPRSPLSRLAIHTQGAPLILAGRYSGRKHGSQHGVPGPPGHPAAHASTHYAAGPKPCGPAGPAGPAGPRTHRPLGPPCGPLPSAKQGSSHMASQASDSLSVASDESSGHSENSLPRIIKPRKRRKKDRKPPGPTAPTTPATSAGSSDAAHGAVGSVSGPAASTAANPVPTVSLKSLGGEAREDHADEPKLHHDFDEVKEHEQSDEAVLLCQCRYCDPAGLIWDVDQNCYSPFLTPPQHLSSFPLFISDSSRPSVTASATLFSDRKGSPVTTRGSADLLLRRSWSEPSPSRKLSESSDSQDSDRRSPPSHQALEVSSEIVTSHNGHRDIEIKFFSLPATEFDSNSK